MIHKALNMAEEGDVLIVSGGESGRSLMGELMFRYAASKKLAGIVVDGPIPGCGLPARFSAARVCLGIYSGRTIPRRPGRNQRPRRVLRPECGARGHHLATATASSSSRREMRPVCTTQARQSHERDLAKTENARRGLFDRGWVDGALERKGCEIVEGPWR